MLINRKAGQEYGWFRYAALYSELKGKIAEKIAKYPGQLRLDTIGRSNEGRDILLVTLGADTSDAAMRAYAAERRRAFAAPRAFQQEIKDGYSPRIPLFFNCNLHGSEISGTDGMLLFIDEVLSGPLQSDLSACYIFISLCMNPDGRSRGFDILNGHGVDMNRDWMAQSQPEVRALLEGVFSKYYPTIMVDLHGFMSSANVLIDACTPPHNPFAEYDLQQEHLVADARSMARVIGERLSVDVDIPALVWKDGWEDYSPIYTPVFFICCGAIAHTLETNFPSEEGADVTRCAAVGVLDYTRGRAAELVANQCEIYARGIENRQDKSLHMPAFYRIPAAGQTDLAVVYDTVRTMLRCSVSVFRDAGGDFIVPSAQPLRALVHNMLWEGEDISGKVDNCYDISFYSYPAMRGIRVLPQDTQPGPLQPVTSVEAVYPPCALKDGEAVACTTQDAFALANLLTAAGGTVRREAAAGAFLLSPQQRDTVAAFSRTHDLRAVPAAGGPAVVFRSPRILAVTDSGAVDELLSDLGYRSDFLLFSELNRGYKIDPAQYDVLLIGGTELGLWNDVFDEELGCSFQTSWALRRRGRQELIRAAKLFRRRIFYGYSGRRLNEEIGAVNCEPAPKVQPSTATGGETAENWMLSVPNGTFLTELDAQHPLCLGYAPREVFYMVAPEAYASAKGETPIRFAPKGSYIRGFNKRCGETDGRIAAVCSAHEGCRDVVLGFDPTFRRYMDHSYRLLFNALDYVMRDDGS